MMSSYIKEQSLIFFFYRASSAMSIITLHDIEDDTCFVDSMVFCIFSCRIDDPLNIMISQYHLFEISFSEKVPNLWYIVLYRHDWDLCYFGHFPCVFRFLWLIFELDLSLSIPLICMYGTYNIRWLCFRLLRLMCFVINLLRRDNHAYTNPRCCHGYHSIWEFWFWSNREVKSHWYQTLMSWIFLVTDLFHV